MCSLLIYNVTPSVLDRMPEASFYDEERPLFRSFSQITRRPHFAYPVHFCNKLEISVFISSDAAPITRTSCLRLQRSCNQNLGMRTRFVPPSDSTTGANHWQKQGEPIQKSGLSSTFSVCLSICWWVWGRFSYRNPCATQLASKHLNIGDSSSMANFALPHL